MTRRDWIIMLVVAAVTTALVIVGAQLGSERAEDRVARIKAESR
jgi:hypothetical protein